MKFKFILISAFISLISTNSFSKAEWLHISSDQETEVYIDVNSIQEFKQYYPATTHKAWIKIKMKKGDKTQTTQKGNKFVVLKGDKFVVLTYFDCKNRFYGNKSANLYRNNKVINQDSYPQVTMEDPVPDSIADKALEYVCS